MDISAKKSKMYVRCLVSKLKGLTSFTKKNYPDIFNHGLSYSCVIIVGSIIKLNKKKFQEIYVFHESTYLLSYLVLGKLNQFRWEKFYQNWGSKLIFTIWSESFKNSEFVISYFFNTILNHFQFDIKPKIILRIFVQVSNYQLLSELLKKCNLGKDRVKIQEGGGLDEKKMWLYICKI